MIQRNTDNFTGFIIQDTEKVYFHAQDKIFYFKRRWYFCRSNETRLKITGSFFVWIYR